MIQPEICPCFDKRNAVDFILGTEVQLDIVIVSGIPGTGLDDCIEAIKYEAASRKPPIDIVGPVTVEDKFVFSAEQDLKQYVTIPNRPYNFRDCLRLPFEEFLNNARRAFAAAAESLANQKGSLGFLTLHPVYFHQVSREFIAPYCASSMGETLAKLKLIPKFVLSIHDDIFDVHANLMRNGEMFCPAITYDSDRKKRRNAEHDLYEQLLLLSWRDRELTAARSMGSTLSVKHFLFHKKSRAKSVVDVVCENKRCVYFSHPISQPRRDINNDPDPVKCPEPNLDRGKRLLEECQDVADIIGKFAAVIEPTGIDEYRIAFELLKSLNEAQHLKSAIMPPLSWRWPIGKGERLAKSFLIENAHGLTQVTSSFPGNTSDPREYSTASLAGLEDSCRLVAKEMRRQITVRDSLLASQVDLVFAYRPFSLPYSPQPTGGVEKEMEIISQKGKAGKTTFKPVLIIFHPDEDEIRRRNNLFRQIWAKHVDRLNFSSDQAKVQVFDKIGARLIDLSNVITNADFRNIILTAFREHDVTAKPVSDESVMNEEALTRSERAMDEVVELLVQTEIVESRIRDKEQKSHGLIQIMRSWGDSGKLGNYIRNLLEGA